MDIHVETQKVFDERALLLVEAMGLRSLFSDAVALEIVRLMALQQQQAWHEGHAAGLKKFSDELRALHEKGQL